MRTASMWSLACRFFFLRINIICIDQTIFFNAYQAIMWKRHDRLTKYSRSDCLVMKTPECTSTSFLFAAWELSCRNIRGPVQHTSRHWFRKKKIPRRRVVKNVSRFARGRLSRYYYGCGRFCRRTTSAIGPTRTRCLGSVQRNRGSCCCADFALSKRVILTSSSQVSIARPLNRVRTNI